MIDDIEGAREDRDEAIARAEKHANPAWATAVMEIIKEVAQTQEYFSTDDVERLRITRQKPSTHEKRAMGPIMRNAWKAGGYCTPTKTWVQSQHRECHGRPKRLWASLLYKAP